jgi:hypothetical protein
VTSFLPVFMLKCFMLSYLPYTCYMPYPTHCRANQIYIEQLTMDNIRNCNHLFYSFFNLGARWRWVVKATPRPLYPQERDPVPIVQETGRVRKMLPLPAFDPRTLQPVASCYTDCVIAARVTLLKIYNPSYKYNNTNITASVMVHILG